MPERLKIEVAALRYSRGEIAHIVLAGVLDAQTVEAFETAVEEAARTATQVVVEAKALTFLSSAGAGALLVAARNAQERGGALVLASPGRAVRDVLEALGVDA